MSYLHFRMQRLLTDSIASKFGTPDPCLHKLHRRYAVLDKCNAVIYLLPFARQQTQSFFFVDLSGAPLDFYGLIRFIASAY